MADFLTRLIERSRGLAPQGQQVEPLIAPFYAAGPNTAPPYDEMDEETASIVEPEPHSLTSQRGDFAPRIAGAAFAQQPEENISIAPLPRRQDSRDKDTTEIKSARATPDETQSARPNQTPVIEPLPQAAILKPPAPANVRLELTDQPRRANREPLSIRPQPLARPDDSNSRPGEAANEVEMASPVIRVTIGRVDVRAVTASTSPPRRETPPKPKLSLEEYLRSRSGRK